MKQSVWERYGSRGGVHQTGFLACTLAAVALFTAGCPVPVPPDGTPDFDSAPAPGLNIEFQEVVIPADLRPEVTFRATDDGGNVIPVREFTDARLILAFLESMPIDASTARFTSYTTSTENPDGVPNSGDEAVQANYDTARLNGLTQNADGSLTYKFARALPAGYNAALVHQIGGQFQRRSAVDGASYPANAVDAFRPDGGALADLREIVDTETCNNCHTRLSAHGIRREIQLCILCHSKQTADANTGNTVDFAQMIHKIHRGEGLPSVEAGHPYQIIGFGGSIHDYSDVVFPQDVRNCVTCHTNGAAKIGPDVYLSNPTLEGCGSCHDRTWFGNPAETPAEFEDHAGGQQVNNSLCSLCHTPTAPGVSPIREAHTPPAQSDQAPGLFFEITDIAATPVTGGTQLAITFTAADKNGAPYTSLTQLNAVAASVAYPATDYQTVNRETVGGGTSQPTGSLVTHGDGSYTYTFAALLPATSEDTFAVGMEGRLNFLLDGVSTREGTSSNAVTYFTLDAKAVTPRRQVINQEKCDTCHREIRAHGDQRFGVDYCVFCHNPSGTDAARRPTEMLPPETINFKDMIHRIHTGEELESGYTVYGFGNQAHDFTEVLFPGLRQECTICHASGTQNVPLTEGVQPTVVTQDSEIVSTEFPESAACTSCHDALVSNVHAMLATDATQGIESCAVCHGEEAAFAVELVHELEP